VGNQILFFLLLVGAHIFLLPRETRTGQRSAKGLKTIVGMRCLDVSDCFFQVNILLLHVVELSFKVVLDIPLDLICSLELGGLQLVKLLNAFLVTTLYDLKLALSGFELVQLRLEAVLKV